MSTKFYYTVNNKLVMSGGKLMYTVKFGDIAATNNTTLYSKPMGGINWAWGHNLYGSIGNNSVIYQSTPVSIQGQRKTICKVDGGNNNFNFIDNRGQVWGWGYGTNGGLGNNSVIFQSTPVSIHGAKKTFCQISVGANHSHALDNRGLMWSWGVNNFGKLAVFSTVYYSTPVSILGAKKTFCIVQAIQQHAMAIDYTGLIWTWGNSNNGQTGINLTTTTHSTPVSILGARKTFCSINTGGNLDSYGLDYKGQIWSWGYNNNGQLGINSSLNQSTPVSILGNKKTFCYMYGNGSYCMSIDYKGQVWGWGYNGFGQLGINSIVNQSTPVSVQGAKKTFCRIVIGQYYNIALDYNGNLWAWGLNNNGQLGDFTTQYKSTPILINI